MAGTPTVPKRLVIGSHRNKARDISYSLKRMGLLGAVALSLGACTAATVPTLPSDKYDYDAIINQTQAAFGRRDADSAVEVFEEDGAFYRITDDGVEEIIRGKENLRRSMRMLFSAESTYTESKAVRLGLFQNLLVMYHEDRYETEDGEEMIPRVVIIEHRNGKRWREWEFSPKDR